MGMFCQANDLISLKQKSETVKSASKQVSRFRVVFTRLPVLTIDTSINYLVFTNPCNRLDNLKLYSVFGSGFLIDHALSILVNILYILI